MESITKFLDPKSVPEVTGDDLDIDDALDNKSDLSDDSDTIEVDLSKEAEKPKVSDVVLPGKIDSETAKDDSSEESSDTKESDTSDTSDKSATVDSSEVDTEKAEDSEQSKDTDKSDSDKENAKEEVPEQGEKEETPEQDTKEDSAEDTAENESVEDSSASEQNDPEQDTAEENVESEDTANPEVDHGESDLDVDTQEPEPLLKLTSEYDFASTKVFELPNGAKVIYLNKPSEICYCEFDFKVGAYFEDDTNRGISHLLEHLMFNGCPGMSSLEFNARMDKMGMSINAYTGRLVTAYHFSGLKSNFIPAFELYANLIKSFTATQEILDKERGVVINEIGVRNDDNWVVLSDAICANAYRQHPVSHPVIGYENVIENISLDQVKSWYETNYIANNLTIYLVGDFPDEDLVFVANVAQQFNVGTANTTPVFTDTMALPSYKNVVAHKEGAVQTLIDSSLPFINEAFNLYEIQILSEVLGGTMSSYLWNEFREQRSIAYRVSSYTACLDPRHLNIHLYAGLNDSDDVDLAKSLFTDAFNYAKAISEDDFNKGLNIVLANILKSSETEEGMLEIVTESIFYGTTPDEYISAIKNLTYTSYQSFADQIDPEKMVTGILYPMS